MSNCKNNPQGFFRRCKFEARYDVSEPIIPNRAFRAEEFNPDDWKRKTYVRDICIKCGTVIERKNYDDDEFERINT